MKINIKATGIELTPAISDYATKKISSLSKYLGNEDVTAHVEVGKTTDHHRQGQIYKAEVRMSGSGLDLYAVSEMEELYAAIDTVRDEITRELKRVKGRNFKLARRGGLAVKNMMKGLWSGATKVSKFRFRRRS